MVQTGKPVIIFSSVTIKTWSSLRHCENSAHQKIQGDNRISRKCPSPSRNTAQKLKGGDETVAARSNVSLFFFVIKCLQACGVTVAQSFPYICQHNISKHERGCKTINVVRGEISMSHREAQRTQEYMLVRVMTGHESLYCCCWKRRESYLPCTLEHTDLYRDKRLLDKCLFWGV